MFMDCNNLKTIDISSFKTTNVTTMQGMFLNDNSLEELDLSSFSTGKLKYTSQMFSECHTLKCIYVTAKFVVTKVGTNDSSSMFYRCNSLIGGNGTSYSHSHQTKEYARIDTDSTPGYFTDINQKQLNTLTLFGTGGSVLGKDAITITTEE